jgi:hypothetical protein
MGDCADNCSGFIAKLSWTLQGAGTASAKLMKAMKAFVLELYRGMRYLPFPYLKSCHALPGARQ